MEKATRNKLLENIKYQMRISSKNQKIGQTYPLVPYSNEYVEEFKERYIKELQWKKDELEEINKQFWEVQDEFEHHQRYHNQFKFLAEQEAEEHKQTNIKYYEAENQRI